MSGFDDLLPDNLKEEPDEVLAEEGRQRGDHPEPGDGRGGGGAAEEAPEVEKSGIERLIDEQREPTGALTRETLGLQEPPDEEAEHMMREMAGYSKTEKRTRAERDFQAKKMLEAHPMEVSPDVVAVWGNDPFPALAIEAWGLEAFLASEPHRLMREEKERAAKLTPVQQAFIEARKKKDKR